MQELQLAVQSLEISIHLYCGSHVGREKGAYQPSFPHNIIQKCPTSITLFSLVQITSNLVQRNVVWFYRPGAN